jgi:hypothetical protein
MNDKNSLAQSQPLGIQAGDANTISYLQLEVPLAS